VTILLAATGWYIVRTEITFVRLLPGLASIALYIVSDVLSATVSLNWIDIVIVLLGIGALAMYIRCVTKAIHASAMEVIAHLVVIQESGIAPKTTPIYKKYRMFTVYSRMLIAYCCSLVIALLLGMFLSELLWPPQFLNLLIDLGMCIGMAWLFSFREEKLQNYVQIHDQVYGETSMITPSTISRTNLDEIDLEEIEQSEGGKPYESGMQLPPPPRFIEPGDRIADPEPTVNNEAEESSAAPTGDP
jgi:hypothetical protein